MSARRIAAYVLCLYLTALASTASAAEISEIAWTVTGGSFSGGVIGNGPITGGSLVFTASPNPISTPLYSSYDANGTWVLLLQGTGDILFSAVIKELSGAIMNVRSNYVRYTQTVANLFTVYSNGVGNTHLGGFNVVVSSGNGFGNFSPFFTFNFSHYFTLGNEVRTFVPEPSRWVLLGVGLGFLAVVRSMSWRR